MQKYNKETAQKKVDELNSTIPEKICPLMGGKKCKKLCTCWMNAQIKEHVEDKEHGLKDVYFTIVGHGCSNAMFTGERFCNNQP